MKATQASRKHATNRLLEQIQAYFLNHAHGVFYSLGQLSRAPFTSAMTILVLAVAVSLASSFYIVVANIQQVTRNFQETHNISLFLRDSVTENAAQKLAEQIQHQEGVAAVKFISKAQALDEFRANSSFADALNKLDSNPLPNVIQVTPEDALHNADIVGQLHEDFKQNPQIELVQVDMQWVERVQAIMSIVSLGVKLVAILLALAVTFITGNTIRLELQNRQDEVCISKLMGATDAFIARPFLYSGFWLGFIAGFLAWLIVTIMLLILESPVEKLSALYNGSFQLMYLGFFDFLCMLLLSAGMAMLGAWGVLQYQLRRIRPQ